MALITANDHPSASPGLVAPRLAPQVMQWCSRPFTFRVALLKGPGSGR
jgi:hypothetical protein